MDGLYLENSHFAAVQTFIFSELDSQVGENNANKGETTDTNKDGRCCLPLYKNKASCAFAIGRWSPWYRVPAHTTAAPNQLSIMTFHFPFIASNQN